MMSQALRRRLGSQNHAPRSLTRACAPLMPAMPLPSHFAQVPSTHTESLRPHRCVRLGLTGGIGSGKSTVAALLAERGAVVIDADAVARSITAVGGAALPAIRAQFGDAVCSADGAMDRAAMRELVFSRPQARVQLEAIVHPLVTQETQRQLHAAQRQGAAVVVHDIPLLVESGKWTAQLDAVMVVDCDEATQVQRVMQRSGLTESAIRSIMAAQASRDVRRDAADVLLFNGQKVSIDQLRAHADEIATWFGL
jgi:dephospho-CoA kinase